MSPAELLMSRFLLASGGCLAAGLAVWAVTTLCRRRLPDFAAQRSLWLLSQITIVAAFLVILLPHSERLRIIPQIDLESATQSGVASANTTATKAPATGTPASSGAPASETSWLASGAQAWLLIYLLGLGYAIGKLVHARRMLNGLAAAGSRMDARHPHDGFAGSAQAARTPDVIEVDAPISPMLFGLIKPRLLLPRHLRSLAPVQQQLIVAHELTHLRRHDLQWMSAGVLLQTLLWFNPFMRLLRVNLSWAQELGCDRDVLRGRPQLQRKAYAAALVAQLRLQHHTVATALAFGGVSERSVAARIALIREPASAPRRPWARCAALASLAGIVLGSLAFQPALAWRIDAAPHAAQKASPASASTSSVVLSCTAMIDAASGQRLVHEGQCDERVTPASTFNIAVSLMGYDSGFLRDEHAPVLAFKEGYADWNDSWRASTDPTSWMRNSTVWYAQQVSAHLGAAQFQRYINDFDYGNREVLGEAGDDNALPLSWISSTLAISPVEQLAFLRKVVNRELGLAPAAYDMTARITRLDKLHNGWEIHGKTGTSAPVSVAGPDDAQHEYGWFVGWASKGGRTVIFARLVLDPRQEGHAAGTRTKKAFLRDLPARLDALN
ncbi:class D beta-lactamase [Massilia sp. CCM 8733]|uniref:Class D beta-lactamase n=1 Tax=Massilia mucilaginosa TaxID=2609282 RepID=A0ABX0NRK5_9BURK|nr:class D beta-lactamase [Massilia mucilaginosa]NHZ89483.1 class D beta-lactamase [Massilia mucilaginosa]